MTKINHTTDRSKTFTFDLFTAPGVTTPDAKMAAAWDAIRDLLGDRSARLAADMDVAKIERQITKTSMHNWHIVTVKCSARAYRAFNNVTK